MASKWFCHFLNTKDIHIENKRQLSYLWVLLVLWVLLLMVLLLHGSLLSLVAPQYLLVPLEWGRSLICHWMVRWVRLLVRHGMGVTFRGSQSVISSGGVEVAIRGPGRRLVGRVVLLRGWPRASPRDRRGLRGSTFS